MQENKTSAKFIKIGIIFTVLAAISYPILYYVDLGLKLELLLMLLFAFSIALSAAGIYHFLALNKKSPCLELGIRLNILAALVFAISGSVAISLQSPLEGILVQGDQSFTYALSERILMGLNFTWKMLFGLGLIFLGKASIGHPKTGKILPILGILIGLLILIVNFYAFPIEPKNAGLIGMGALLPIWHVLLTLIMALSGNWVNDRVSVES